MSTNEDLEFSAEELERELTRTSTEGLAQDVSQTGTRLELAILDLNALGKSYTEELSQLRHARKEMVEKKNWYERSIRILDRRIEVALSALKTLQMPDVQQTENQARVVEHGED